MISTIVFKLLSCGPAIISPNFLHRLCIWGGYFCASFCTSMDTVARVLFCFQINQHLVLFEIWMIPCCPGILTSEPSHPPASVSLALGSHVCNSTDTEPQKEGQSTSRDSLWHGAFILEDISTSQKDSVHLKTENLGGFLDSVLWYGRDASFLILGRLLDVQQHPSLLSTRSQSYYWGLMTQSRYHQMTFGGHTCCARGYGAGL